MILALQEFCFHTHTANFGGIRHFSEGFISVKASMVWPMTTGSVPSIHVILMSIIYAWIQFSITYFIFPKIGCILGDHKY